MLGSSPRILVADDHPLFRDALCTVIDGVFPAACVSEVRSFAELRSAVDCGRVDLVFVDLMMPGSGVDVVCELARLRASIPATPMLVVSSRDDAETVAVVRALGVTAFLSKSATRAELIGALRAALGGCGDYSAPADGNEPAQRLSPRQSAVLELLARGRSNKQIAGALAVEEITVKAHISAILRKLHVKSRLEAVVATRGNFDRR